MVKQNTQTQKGLNVFELGLQIVKATRPVHWIKNLALFAALVFSGGLMSKPLVITAVIAFIIFSLATSATYIFNDIMDAKLDRLHPIKRFRPVASGKLPVKFAALIMIMFVLLALFMASRFNELFFLSVAGYIVLQLVYSLGLKNVPVVDIIMIAAGFVLRVYAGAFVIDAHLSVWFLLCVISAALFLASGKRRAELGAISATKITTRKSLTHYPKALLDSYVTMFGSASWMSWALYTFFESPVTEEEVWLFLAEISRTTTISKLMMITIPLAIFSIMRYQSLIFENKSEAPEKLLLKDVQLIVSLLLWVGSVVIILYGGIAEHN
jgi:decaprenyl-phosphate phosphoribosyltransferase